MHNATDPQGGLTEHEQEIMAHLVAAWNLWLKYDVHSGHASEQEKRNFRDGMHQIQHVLGDRALHRAYPDYWNG